MKGRSSTAAVGEFAFLRALLPTLHRGRGVVVGPGDDCAAVRLDGTALLTTDAQFEGVHFRRDWLTPEQIGARAMLVNLSDIAAMGGRPRFALLSVGVPSDLTRADLARLHRGAERAARAAGVAIVGGNLSAAGELSLTITLIGTAARPILRRGALPGDLLFVTGTLGDAAGAVQLLRSRMIGTAKRGRNAAHAALLRRYAAPTPRLETGRRLAAAGVVSSMIDVSDGLIQDLGHVCDASRVGAVVYEENVPRSSAYERVVGPDLAAALGGGEDYELLFTVPRAALVRFERLHRRLPDPVSFIGEIVARRGVRLHDASGRLRRPARGGFDHFRPA